MTEELDEKLESSIEVPESVSDALSQALTDEDFGQAALVLESLPHEQRLLAWDEIPDHKRLNVLVELRGESQKLLIRELPEPVLLELFADMEAEDLLELADALPGRLIDKALASMDQRQRSFYDSAQKYDDDQVGHWLNRQILVVPQNTHTSESLRVLRREVPDHTEVLYLANRIGHWTGCVLITDIITAPDHRLISELRLDEYPTLSADMDIVEASLKVVRSGYAALPVLDSTGLLLGRLDIRTASEVIQEDAESKIMAGAGLAEDADLFAPVRRSAETRAIWLGINLLTALLASWFIGLFEATLEKVVVLAVLMPVVASMGGIAGSQTLTLIVRGLALGQISRLNMAALLSKEVRVGWLNGVLWALVIGVVVAVWFGNIPLGFVIGGAIITNIVTAAVSGVLIPIVLDKLEIDPALSGAVILTTVTDVVGFVAFLGLGTIILT
ncbi:magnesium transporter [Teredinibacter waterburyi]|jgi:Mg2+ transporter (mgtE)|uniref:magnesium transporter n=1 Tax=Teredinibacter waterburyi TaxID=1500538 RepID=UPI00165EF7B3|nr:magnesium transporter [Teredinibacter waterburyi]